MTRRKAPRHAPKVMARLDELARFSSQVDGLTRLFLTPEHKAAAREVMPWMREAGMSASMDAMGTVVGRYEAAKPGGKTLLIGSHIDTVRNAGKYDGNLGVVMAIAAVGELDRRGKHLPFAIEVLAFGDEEGVRFPKTLSSSKALTGMLDPSALEIRDGSGLTLRQALEKFGSDVSQIKSCARRTGDLIGYLEVHIEQGPVLENEDLPVGIVTAISGASRFLIEVTGMAGHAGTVPLALRRDAVAGAAEMILAVEAIARSTPALLATVGRVEARPGVVNVIPSGALFSLDVRSPMDRTRRAALTSLQRIFKEIAQRRRLTFKMASTYEEPAVACSQRFIRQFSAAIERAGIRVFGLPSGAGHDGVSLARICPIGMLFVRCKKGISHHPDKSIKAEDAEVATRILIDVIEHLDATR